MARARSIHSIEIQAELVDSSGIARGCKAFRGASGMDSNAMLLTLTHLDARGGQLDQALEQVGRRASAALRVPEPSQTSCASQ